MGYYVVAGKPDCSDFVHVLHLCDYLAHHLPNFSYRKIEETNIHWCDFLCDTNRKNNWHHVSSPLIWKEVSRRGGKASYIGGVSEFWEYVYDYYGLESVLPLEDIENLVKDNVQFYESRKKQDEERYKRIMKITVSGIRNPMIRLIIPALADMKNLRSSHGLIIRYYDIEDLEDHASYVESIMAATLDMMEGVQLIFTLQQALEDCDLYIELSDYSRRIDETPENWLTRNMAQMSTLGDAINTYAKRGMKVLLAHPGPCCFNASLLVQYCTTIRPANIIAITADRGSILVSMVAREMNMPLAELSAPPVWGLWLYPYIDLESVIKKSSIHRPYARAVRTNGSTLPLGVITTQLSYMNYVVDDVWDLLNKVVEFDNTMLRILGRPPTYAKAMATIKVIQTWYAGEPSNEIISLGICSNGCFGFPPGVVVSQPAIFDGKNWVPFKNFPLPEQTKARIEVLTERIEAMFADYNFRAQCFTTGSKIQF